MTEKSLGQIAFDAYKAERKKDPHSNLLAGWPAQYKEEWECAALAVVAAHESRKWRKVEDGLPEGLVLVYCPDAPTDYERVYLAEHRKGTFFIHIDEQKTHEVTHWMPLPAPPETEGGKG